MQSIVSFFTNDTIRFRNFFSLQVLKFDFDWSNSFILSVISNKTFEVKWFFWIFLDKHIAKLLQSITTGLLRLRRLTIPKYFKNLTADAWFEHLASVTFSIFLHTRVINSQRSPTLIFLQKLHSIFFRVVKSLNAWSVIILLSDKKSSSNLGSLAIVFIPSSVTLWHPKIPEIF